MSEEAVSWRPSAVVRALWLACIPVVALVIGGVLLADSASIVGRDAIYPRAVLITLLLVAAVALVRDLLASRRREPDTDDSEGDAEGGRGRHVAWKRVGVVALALVAMPLLLPTAGYLVSTAVLTAAVALALGLRSSLATAALVVGVSAGSYLLFVVLLGARIPAGGLLP
jgi:hypothetical protein